MDTWEKITHSISVFWKKKRSKDVSLSFEDKRFITRHFLLWRIGTCTTNLRVYGRVKVNGKELEARSKNFVLIRKGTNIRVVGMENSTLLVEPLSGCPLFWLV